RRGRLALAEGARLLVDRALDEGVERLGIELVERVGRKDDIRAAHPGGGEHLVGGVGPARLVDEAGPGGRAAAAGGTPGTRRQRHLDVRLGLGGRPARRRRPGDAPGGCVGAVLVVLLVVLVPAAGGGRRRGLGLRLR